MPQIVTVNLSNPFCFPPNVICADVCTFIFTLSLDLSFAFWLDRLKAMDNGWTSCLPEFACKKNKQTQTGD